MKRLAAVLLLMCLMPVSCLAGSSPLLYRVTDDQGHYLYLFGTIHVGSDDMYPLSPQVEAAFRDADELAVEADVSTVTSNGVAAFKYLTYVMYGIGDDASRHLSPEVYEKTMEYLRIHVPGEAAYAERLKPIMLSSMVETSILRKYGCTEDKGIDNYLIQRAGETGKPVTELEGMDEQLIVIGMAPDEAAEESLRRMLFEPEQSEEELRTLVSAWIAGDAETLAMVARTDPQDYPEAVREKCVWYDRMLFDERNDRFAAKAVEALKDGRKLFIAIGAGHIVGTTGLVSQLSAMGYRVEEIGRGD